jgi:glycine cleavage system protein P-like pyridoxal-binding family
MNLCASGITRAREAGFDLCHFNLHKTFSTPHGSGGPAAGASGVTEALAPFLPAPWVVFTGERYALEYDCPQSIGKIRPYQGVAQNLLKAYAWIMSLGADGLRAVAETAVLNNNYLMHKVVAIRGASAPYATGKRRIEQVRYSWAQLTAETGIHSEDIGARVVDFGTHYWTSHHPFVVPEPMTLEPTESYSQGDLDEYAAILGQVAAEATAIRSWCARRLTRAPSIKLTTPRWTTHNNGPLPGALTSAREKNAPAWTSRQSAGRARRARRAQRERRQRDSAVGAAAGRCGGSNRPHRTGVGAVARRKRRMDVAHAARCAG